MKSREKSSFTLLTDEDEEEKGKEIVEDEEGEDNNSHEEEMDLYGLSELATVALEQRTQMQVSNASSIHS